MKLRGQSLIEFAVILMSVTIIAMISLHIVSKKINSQTNNTELLLEENASNMSLEEINCTKMGLYWDKNNGVCEAK